jgi:nicotinamide-nucleotide amidase
MQELLPLAHDVAALLTARRQTLAVAESSAGGLIAASLLAVPGASAYFLGGAVIYTREARRALLGITDEAMKGLRSSSEPYAALLAETVRLRHGASWGLAETGAAGPTGNRYGDSAGHACLAINGPSGGPSGAAWTVETGSTDRFANMRRFAAEALLGLAAELRRV